MLPIINCDLDGVLVDFERGFEMFYGMHPHSLSEPEMWKYIDENADHWHDLPAMPGALKLWAKIAPYNARIITGCPKTGYNAAATGKRHWIARELGKHVPVITCLSRDKQHHMQNEGDILIDDMAKNIKRWNDAGGHGILFEDAQEVVDILTDMGY